MLTLSQRAAGHVQRDWRTFKFYWDREMSVQKGGIRGLCQVHKIFKVSKIKHLSHCLIGNYYSETAFQFIIPRFVAPE